VYEENLCTHRKKDVWKREFLQVKKISSDCGCPLIYPPKKTSCGSIEIICSEKFKTMSVNVS
jgi:hypothetical protein